MSYPSPKSLTVLHIATINKPVGPGNGYSPIETVIYNIDTGLHELGHRSIVACSADSNVTGEQYATVPRSLGDYCRSGSAEGRAAVDRHLALALARAQAGDIDVIHMHEWFERVYDGRFDPPVPIVMTLHVPGNRSGLNEYRAKNPAAFAASRNRLHPVAISEYQRGQYADLVPVAKTVPHGLAADDYAPNIEPGAGSYLFSIGRITEEKGQDTAIEVARKSGSRLIIAGCVQDKAADRAFFAHLERSIDLSVDIGAEPVTADYYERVMQPILSSQKQVIYVGELSAEAAKHWYRHATATVFPIRWGEPFGMVLIESMASGTPLLAFGKGSVPEIVRDGETGFIVDSVDAMAAAVARIPQLDRAAASRHVRANFSVQRMAAGYAALYQQLATPVRVHRPARRLIAAGAGSVASRAVVAQ